SPWDRRALRTGMVAALCYVVAFHNACGTVSALLYGVTAAALRPDGGLADPARPVARVRWHWSARGVGRGLLVGMLLGGSILLEGLLADPFSGGADKEYIASPEPLVAAW